MDTNINTSRIDIFLKKQSLCSNKHEISNVCLFETNLNFNGYKSYILRLQFPSQGNKQFAVAPIGSVKIADSHQTNVSVGQFQKVGHLLMMLKIKFIEISIH